jgi:hypothetical protein
MDDEIQRAIANHQVIEFDYKARHRAAEPHVLGIHNGRKQVLVYQTGGESSSGALPQWRRMDGDDISGLRVTGEKVPGRRPTGTGEHTRWDRVIAVVE